MDYTIINKNSIKIIEILKEGRTYFNEIHEKTGIKSKNNLLKNLNSLALNKILTKEENKSNTYYSINYQNNVLIALLSLIHNIKFEGLPFNAKKSIFESISALKPKMAVLFGSFAKGSYKKNSDIDLLFFDALEEKEKIKEISKSYGVQINVIFMKFKETDFNSESVRHIVETGYPLMGEIYFYNKIKKI